MGDLSAFIPSPELSSSCSSCFLPHPTVVREHSSIWGGGGGFAACWGHPTTGGQKVQDHVVTSPAIERNRGHNLRPQWSRTVLAAGTQTCSWQYPITLRYLFSLRNRYIQSTRSFSFSQKPAGTERHLIQIYLEVYSYRLTDRKHKSFLSKSRKLFFSPNILLEIRT